MKRITSTLLLLLAITFAWGQTEQRQMILNMKDGTKRTFNTEDIDFVNFIKVEVSPEGELNIDGTLSIAIPTEFYDSYVMDVKQGDDKIAEICLEYIIKVGCRRSVKTPFEGYVKNRPCQFFADCHIGFPFNEVSAP